MKFEYVFLDGEYIPLIPLKLFGKGEQVEVKAYIDTGADYCIFHAEVAEIIGIEIYSGELHAVKIGDGNFIKIYLHKIPISLAGKEFIATVGFSKEIGIGFNILGRKDIFDNFIICFNERKKYIGFISLP